MKRIIALLLGAALVAAMLCACVPADDKNEDSDRLSIVTTIFPPYDFARQIAGENADINMLLKPGMESHSYDPTPQDIIMIQNCDLFIYCGGESDKWVDSILSSGKMPKKIISMMDCVDAVEEVVKEGMTVDEEEEEGDSVEYDEHVWTSPRNASLITRKISEALIGLDAEHAEEYKSKTTAYAAELSALDDSYRRTVENGSRKLIVFGDRFPFRYLTDEYGLNYYAAFPGCSSETEPSAATISFLIDKVNEKKIPVVFTIEFSNGKVADTICSATGAKKLMLHSCHNVSADDFKNGATYVSLMQNNLKSLEEALS